MQPLYSNAIKGIHLFIRGVLLLMVTDISFLVAAKFLAKRNNWNVKRAMAIGQLLWLPVAYFIAVHTLTSIPHINDTKAKTSTIESQQPEKGNNVGS